MATYQVSAGTDDCFRSLHWLTGTYWSLTINTLLVGNDTSNYRQHGSGMRFNNINIPRGATITSAYLTFVAAVSKSDVANSRVSAEDVDNAVTFADDEDAFDTRYANHTTAVMDWDAIASWSEGVAYNSPTTDGVTTFASIIQEVIDRAGWASGNSIVLFWEDFDDRTSYGANHYRSAWSYEGTTAPILTINYTVGVTVTTQAVTVISGTTATGNGNVTSLGYPNPTQHGHCWNTTGTPTTADSKTQNGVASATGAFTSAITGLVAGTIYYVRAYATNTAGTSYGGSTSFKADIPLGSEQSGIIAIVETRFHYVDAYGVERFIEGTVAV